VKPDPTLISSKRSILHKKYKRSEVTDDIDIIVIGSGMGGLSCAAILARLGRKVVVLEQHNDVCGGGTHKFDLKGYTFDSGLHYTVPWYVPIFALTCLKRPADVTAFDIMGEPDGTVDKVYLVPPEKYVSNGHFEQSSEESNDNAATVKDAVSVQKAGGVLPFNMKYREAHMADLYAQFPEEKKALDEFIRISNNSMLFVKVFIFSRLLPRWLQRYYWSMVPTRVTASVGLTAKELLPTLTSNKRLISLLSSMWIDTGARPDRASFMLTAAVFRGVAMEGGCYPAEGSESLARELVPVIEVLNNSTRDDRGSSY
jgi:all-trans-retinol 13,14-reductase